MITATVTPPEIGLSKDPLVYRLQSDDYTGAVGEVAVNRLYFSGPILAGTVIQLLWNGVLTTLTAAVFPVNNGLQFKSGAGNSAFVTTNLPYFQGNPAISKDFTVSTDLSVPALVFTAKAKGEAFNMSAIAVAGKWGVQNITPGTDEKLRINHCIFMQVYLEKIGGAGQDKIYEVYLPTDADGRAEIDLADVFNSILQPKIENPYWTGSTAVISRATSRKYQLSVAEAYGRPTKIGIAATLPEKRVLWGGSGYFQQAGVSARLYANGLMKALRNGSTIRYVMADEPQWLTFICVEAYITGLQYKMEVVWHDNSTGTYTLASLNQVNNGEKIILPAGITQLNVNSYSTGKRVKEYTLYLKTGSTEKTLRYRYLADANLRDKRKYFVYFNSLGAWECQRANGVEDRTLELKTYSSSKRPAYPQVQGDGEQTDYYVSYEQTFQCSTDWLSREEQKRCRDLFISPKKYRYVNGDLYPIGITSSRLSEQTDDETMLYYQFEYKYLFKNDALLQ
ncbi:hypothetical protein [Runella sp.]|uniref:hypothetical protein n=1 Tax=Runella sp. TaxID=1960881 RepID=UPI003D0DA937